MSNAITTPVAVARVEPRAEKPRGAPKGISRRLQKRRWARWTIWILFAVVSTFGGWRVVRSQKATPIAVQVVRVQRGSVRDFVTSVSAGRVTGQKEASIRAEIAGTVRNLHRRRGDHVKKGEPLIGYDPEELRERVRLAETAVTLAQAQALQADQNAMLAESNATRVELLHRKGSVSDADFESSSTQAKALSRGAEAARASVLQAQASLELARTALGKAVVRAPFDGVVLATSVEIGEASVPGTPMLTLADVSELHVDADVDEADVGRVLPAMPVDVTFDAFPGERLRGSVRMIPPSVTRDAHGGRSVSIEVALPADARLLVGMSADVDVIVAVHDGVLWIPPNAVLGRGAERSVYVVTNGVAHKRTIDVGITTWEAVELKRGLSEGDEVVATLGSAQLTDGARVDPRLVGLPEARR
jgi:HlyD family secretion protein